MEEHNSSIQSQEEEELVVYQERRREEAGRRQQERRRRWELEARKGLEAAQERLEEEKRGREEREEGREAYSEGEIERRLEERLREAQQEREERQRRLILEARAEEQAAVEERERRGRVRAQTERLAPLHTRIKGRVAALLAFWSSQQDKSVFSEEVQTGVTAVLSQCNSLLREARETSAEGRAPDSLWGRLESLERTLGGILGQVEADMAAKLQKEKALLEERTRGEEERSRKEQEAKEAAAAVQTPAAAAAVAPVPAAVPQAVVQAPPPAPPSTPGVLETVCSQANQAWHTQVLSFKADYVKDVTFSEAEKPYKFNLQKAVNTPLNSLSGVSSAHMQDKVDKLVQLLSGSTVTVADKTISTSSHPHGQKFCLALAAKKLAKQGEEVVSSDPKSAFPAATLALALWDTYPDFGQLLLGYMFECCPFLVPLHPPRYSGGECTIGSASYILLCNTCTPVPQGRGLL